MRTILLFATLSLFICACYVGGGGGPISDAAAGSDAGADTGGTDTAASPVPDAKGYD